MCPRCRASTRALADPDFSDLVGCLFFRFFVNFTVIFSSRHLQIQLSAMKQNSCPVVGEAAKPTGVGLDELDGAVEALGAGVADVVLAEVQQSGFMTPEHLDDLSDGLELTSHGIVGPRSEETFGSALVAIAPELGEVLLDHPGPAGLEVELVQGAKRDGLSAAPVGILLEPRLAYFSLMFSNCASAYHNLSIPGGANPFIWAHTTGLFFLTWNPSCRLCLTLPTLATSH